MQNSVAGPSTSFTNAMAPFLLTWQSIEVRAILDTAEGQALSMVTCLSPGPPTPLEDIQPVVRDILFVRGALPISELSSLIDGWKNGSINIGNRVVTTSSFLQHEFVELVKPWDDLTLSWPEFSDYRNLLLYAIGPDISELTKPRSIEALATALGFRSFPEMSEHRVQFKVGQGRSTRMEIFAPILATIEASSEGQEIRFKAIAHHTMRVSDMHMSYRLQDRRGNRVTGDQVKLADFSATSSEGFNILECVLPVAEEVRSGEVNLFHKDYHQGLEPLMTKLFSLPPILGETNNRMFTDARFSFSELSPCV